MLSNGFHTLLSWIRDPGAIIRFGGYPALGTVIFLETGLLAFFLPGDSLLVIAGFYAAQGSLDIVVLNALLGPLAIIGDACAYTIGRRLGRRALTQGYGRWLRPDHMAAANLFYAKHGGKAVVLARFAPLVRTFVPIVAGVANMPYRSFATYNAVGGIGWVASMTLTGYFLGTRFPWLLQHLEKVIIVVVLLSILPSVIEVWRARRKSL